jgi:hypothetical protein
VVGETEDEEIVLDSEVAGLRIALVPVSVRPPRPQPPRAAGFPEDEWASHAPDGRVVAFLREPVARCHLDRVALIDGDRRLERPLPPWVYYGFFVKFGTKRLLVGGPRQAWVLSWDGEMTTLLEEPDAEGVHVCWLDDDTAAAAGHRTIVIDGPAGRTTLPCNHAVSICAVTRDLLVVTDDDGAQWISGGRVVARDWRSIADSHNGVVISAAGDAFRVDVQEG